MHAIGPLTTHTCALIPRTCVRESTGMASSFRELETWTKLDKVSIDTSGYGWTQVDAEQPNFESHGVAWNRGGPCHVPGPKRKT